jgi:uncharacterized membrane protein (UPF0127 family)
MKQTFIAIIIILLTLCNNSCARLNNNIICFNDNCFRVELAQTTDERAKGLMFRKYLAPDKGMLFIFDEEKRHSFWMKNTLIPLDIIWINKDKEVVFIGKDIQPCKTDPCPSINPRVKAKYVLELNAGTAGKISLAVGDKLEFKE